DVDPVGINENGLKDQFHTYLVRAWKRKPDTDDARLLSKWVTKTVNDVIVRVTVGLHGLRMDYVTFGTAVSLMDQLHVLWNTRSFPDRIGWSLWSTAKGLSQTPDAEMTPARFALASPLWLERRLPAAEFVRDVIVE